MPQKGKPVEVMKAAEPRTTGFTQMFDAAHQLAGELEGKKKKPNQVVVFDRSRPMFIWCFKVRVQQR